LTHGNWKYPAKSVWILITANQFTTSLRDSISLFSATA
jgi:hypothetical protein